MRRETRGDRRDGPHIIRLRGPWRTEDGRRVKLPAAWDAALGEAREATLQRPFNWVRDRHDVESVTLRITSPQQVGSIHVNGSELADGGDLLHVLAPSNLLTVELTRRSLEASILEAWLEVSAPAR